jgi:hypothetical protein
VVARTDWEAEDTEAANGGGGGEGTQHLWEESWDDDDTTDDFSTQLKYVSRPPARSPYLLSGTCIGIGAGMLTSATGRS